MRKSILSALLFFTLLFISCGGNNELKKCKGKLWYMTDSTLVASIDGDSICFEARDLQIAGNNIIIPGDSVNISYIGRLSGKCKALIATPIIVLRETDGIFDPNKELITAPEAQE